MEWAPTVSNSQCFRSVIYLLCFVNFLKINYSSDKYQNIPMKQNKRFENNLFKKLPRRKRRQLIRDLHNGVALNFTDIFTLPVTEGSVSESTVVGDRSNYFQKPNEYSPAEVPTCAGVNAESIEFQNSINSEQDNEKCFIHPYCELSPEESNLIITAFALKHNLTKVGTEDLLTLLALHMPRDSFLPSSFYSLMKDLNVDQTSCTTHYICSNCKAYVNAEDSFCEECNFQINVADLRSSNNYFFTFNPAVMLKEILQSEAVADNLAANLRRRNLENTTHVEDIVHGRCYKALHLGEQDFSCSLNTDGISPFRSSKFSLTPVLISINELDYNIRRTNTVLAGLWFSSEKPNYNAFLKPIVDECNKLSTHPIEWSANNYIFSSFVYFPIFVADSVARCAVQGMNQFNGAFGCPWCNQKGETCWITPTTHKWIYPPTCTMDLRTEESFLASLETLAESLQNGSCRQKHINGVKFASPLLTLRKFNIVDGFAYDVMHSAFLGVSKMFTLLWIESSNSSAPYYIGNKVKRMEKLLLNAKVPYEFDRTLRSFSTIKYWKASEWRSWTYVCFSITKGFLPDVYRKHFLKYANSIMLLSDEKITELDFLHAQDQLHSFVYQAKNLYGMKCCTFNLHILLHATNCVRNWGPLWAYSAFQFENFNGILSSMFRSSQQVLTQIRSRFLELMALKHHGTRRIENPVVLEYFQSLLSSHRFMHSACKTNDGCVFLGPSKDYIFSDEEKIKLARIKITCAKGRSFRKCIIHGKIFCTEENATTKRNNAIVATTENKFFVVRKLLYVEFCGIKQGCAIVSRINVFYPEPASSYLISVRSINSRMDIISIASIQRQKFFNLYSLSSELKFLIRLPNIVELE